MDLFHNLLAITFWISAAAILYAYLGYPVVICVLSRLFGKTPLAGATSDAPPPRVALLIAAHNEAAVIDQRIQNALALEYPPGRLEIVIASDGSDDATCDICRNYAGKVRLERLAPSCSCDACVALDRRSSNAAPRASQLQNHRHDRVQIALFDFPLRRGKAATLNAAVAQIDADILVFSDANTSMHPDALRQLTRWFADDNIGAVCGRLILTDPNTGRNVDSLYWKYETFLKTCEGRLGGLLGANGAIYAIRRDLFIPLPPQTLVDDFVAPLLAKMQSGCRIIYDPQAIAFEETAPDLANEYRRRARIGTGGFQALGILWPLLLPQHGWTAFTFWSHKVLRWCCPFFMLATLLTSALLASHPLYHKLFFTQISFYALCGLGAIKGATKLLRLCTLFASMNLALLIGFARWLKQNQTGIWARTQR